jgi:hypothetical protein
MNKVWMLLISICGTWAATQAQKIDSMMGVYAEKFPQEKIYFHFDKGIYSLGETIWFKGYLVADVQPSYWSKNLYTDWYDADGKLMAHQSAPIYDASVRGQFAIPKDYKGKVLRVKAYTQWMLNFDTAFLFNKIITVDQPTLAIKTDTIAPKANIYFFPEGGNLVQNVESRIAIKVTTPSGKPVKAKGIIKNAVGNPIDSFETEHDGMTSFSMVPVPDEVYTAHWTDEWKKPHTTNLPAAQPLGIVLQVKPLSTKVLFVVKRQANLHPAFGQLNVIAHFNQNLVYKSKINFTKSTSVMGEVPIKDLPSGMLQISVFDANWLPVAERVAFVNTQNYLLQPDVNILKKGLSKREKNVLEIHVADTIPCNMSLAVTDAEVPADTANNIVAHLLLNSDVKGYIHQPAYYFSSNNDDVKQHLDLVMLTNGWRRFNWEALAKQQTPDIKFARDTDFLQIKGKVFGHAFERRANLMINLVLQSKDSTKQFLFLNVAKNGDFTQRGVLFYDTIKAFYQFNGDKRLTDIATVAIKNGLIDAHQERLQPLKNYEYLLPNPAIIERTRFFAKEQERINKLLRAQQLDEVTVSTKVKSAVDKLDAQYSSGFFAGGDSYQFDLNEDPFAAAAQDIFGFLQGRVAGLQINNTGAETTLSWRGATPDLYLNEMVTDADQLRTIPVSDIAYLKVFRPPFFGSFGGGAGGAIVVYTKKGSDVKFTPGQGMGFILLPGYTKYKEFFSPNYDANPSTETDVRTTLLWKPYVLTYKKNQTVKVEFYNNDVSKKLRIVLEGINADGKLVHIEKMIE